MGVLVSKHEILSRFFYNKMIFFVSFLCFAVLSGHWSLASGSFDLNDLLKLFIASSAFVIVMNVCRNYETAKVSVNLSLFGRYSMEIYVTHWTFLWFVMNNLVDSSNINSWWVAFFALISSIPIIYACILFSKVVECSPVLRMCLFGRRK